MRRASVRRGHARAAAAADASRSHCGILIQNVMFPEHSVRSLSPNRATPAATPRGAADSMTWDPRQRGTGRFVEDIVGLQVHTLTQHAHTHTWHLL